LKGRNAWEKWTQDGAKQAIDFFERAITVDPNYALAYSGIADAYMIGPGGGLPDAYRHGREAATKALSLDSNLGEPHAAIAGVLLYADWKFAESEKEYQRAIALNPSCAECYHEYSHLLLFLGRFDDSLRQSRKFLELDPVSETPIGHLAYHYCARVDSRTRSRSTSRTAVSTRMRLVRPENSATRTISAGGIERRSMST
jgi:tetratricopeptide (TPR) repeat protein